MGKLMRRMLNALMIMAITCTFVLSIPMNIRAESMPVTKTTTMCCSVWSAPDTTEVNRVKYIDVGYSVSIYPEVIQSTAGDGKTFYMTVKGNYILCKCFEQNDPDDVTVSTDTTVLMITTEECSLWSTPSTAAENLIGKVPAGCGISTYPAVVNSIDGDGRVFYRTISGEYILCNSLVTLSSEVITIVASTPSPTPTPIQSVSEAETQNNSISEQTYILNTNTHKFHRPSCSSVGRMADRNKRSYTGNRNDVINMGYEPCKNCKP